MVSLTSLWLPILLSAVAVFMASSVIHMMLKYHWSDFTAVPNEDGVMNALRPLSIPPGEYVVPHAGSPEGMKSPEYAKKVTGGPVMFVTVLPNEMPNMGSSLLQWFIYCIVVSIFSAYIATRALDATADLMGVLQIAGTAAFMGYGLALLQNSIWYKRKWSTTIKSVFDSLIYALLTGAVFGLMW